MNFRNAGIAAGVLALGLVMAGCRDANLEPSAVAVPAAMVRGSSVASMYVADFVSTAATGVAINDSGDVTGTSYVDPGCGPFCLPTQETVVWRGGARIVLPTIPGLSGIYVRGINSSGWVVGIAGLPGTVTHAVVWKPSGSTYTATDLGTLPGKTISDAAGIDNQGRVIGWSTTSFFPPLGAPFMWTQSGGMVDLGAQGYPVDIPLAISPGGTVATSGFWYQLGNPASAVALPPPPRGFFPPGTYARAINDAGDQAGFLASTSTQNLVYLFRLPHGGAWQQISASGTGHLSRYGIGSINSAMDITGTVLSTGVIAAGPAGLAQGLAPLLAPSYGGAAITGGGPMNNSGQILASVYIGRSPRVMKLVPATPCTGNCLRSSQIMMQGKFIQDPAHPGQCFQGGIMYNRVGVRVTVTDENGATLPGALVKGRFMDDYWTNKPVTGTTNALGNVQFSNKGPCGVGAVAFLVESVSLGSRSFDRTAGTVAKYVIPQ